MLAQSFIVVFLERAGQRVGLASLDRFRGLWGLGGVPNGLVSGLNE